MRISDRRHGVPAAWLWYLTRPSMLIGVVLAGGCLSFVDSADVNLKPDPYFASRNFVSAGGSAFSQDIAGLVGRMAYKDNANAYQFLNSPLIENGKVPQVKAVQSAYSYSSKIDKGYQATVALPFIAPDLTGKTATDYELRDVAVAQVDPAGEPSRAQFQAAALAAGAPPDRPWYWIRSAVLADLRQQQSVNLESKTTVSGSGFSANGTIYNNPTASQWIPLISVDPVPMNDAADADARPPPPMPAQSRVVVSAFPGVEALPGPQFLLQRPSNSALVPVNFASTR